MSEIIKEYCQIPCLYPANFERCIIDLQKEKKEIIEMKEDFAFNLGEILLKVFNFQFNTLK